MLRYFLTARAVIFCAVFVAFVSAQEYQPDGFDVNRVVGFEKCQKCHLQQVEVLQVHPHFQSGRNFHRRDDAKAMARKLGFSSVKRSELCMQCHYTPKRDGDRVKADSGVSCESCHGPAKGWILVHNNYGPLMTRESESPEHRLERIRESLERGMNPPSHLYALARACMRCHVIDNEQLVNVGGHPAHSSGFEMVSWSQGNVRHNFLRSNGQWNSKSDIGRLRMMYVVGILAEMEASLRAAAMTTEKAEFGFRHAARAAELRTKLSQLAKALNLQELRTASRIAINAKLSLGNGQKLVVAADEISRIAWKFANPTNPPNSKSLEAIDALLPSTDEFFGRPVGER